MTHWWRAYDDAIDHPKLLRLSDADFRAWFTLQCIASANDGVLPPAADIAVRLREKPTKIATWLTSLVKAGLIDNDAGVFRPHNWKTRQFKSDSSTSRVKRFRNKERNVSGNVSETLHETAPEAEADSETEQSRADAGAPIDEDLKRKVAALQAGVSAHFVSRNLPIPNLDRCLLWLTQGYPTGTVLSAVETVLKRGKAISTLDYFDGAIKDAHAKAPAPSPLVDSMAGWFLIIEGTPEEICWQQHYRERFGKPMFICTQIHEGREVRGAKKPTLWPPGFNDFGERMPAKEEDAA